ncbi:MAG: hypothetical protein JWO78_61 [Micavibrio sp.]|nr:hypothetical protein [Micavibrio sp.]
MPDLSREAVAEAIKKQNSEVKPEIEVGVKTNFLKDGFAKAVDFVKEAGAEAKNFLQPISPGQGATSVERYKQKNPGSEM